ncbi:MAG: helix-turn-helix domain-containing protein [Halobacteriaceae archaeon]
MSVRAEFHVPPTSFPLGSLLADHVGVAVEIERVVPTGEFAHHVWVAGEGSARAAFVDALADHEPVASVRTLDDLPDRTLLRVAFEAFDAPVLRLVAGAGGTVTRLHGTGDGWTLHVRFADQDGVSDFYEACREAEVSVRLGELYGTGMDDTGDHGLTERQMEALRRAYATGYFDVPRQVTLADLATALGISEQAVSERLRRGLSSLLTGTLPPADGEDSAADEGRA